VFVPGRERVTNCWSDGMDVSIGMCIATEFLERIYHAEHLALNLNG
jgi:hypothetical protein